MIASIFRMAMDRSSKARPYEGRHAPDKFSLDRLHYPRIPGGPEFGEDNGGRDFLSGRKMLTCVWLFPFEQGLCVLHSSHYEFLGEVFCAANGALESGNTLSQHHIGKEQLSVDHFFFVLKAIPISHD